MNKTVKFSDIYGSSKVTDIIEIQMIGQMALTASEDDVNIDVTDLKYGNSVKFCVDFKHIFAVNLNQPNIVSAKLREVPKTGIHNMFGDIEPKYKIVNNECVVDLSDVLSIGMNNIKETLVIRMICKVLYDYYNRNGVCLFSRHKISITMNSDYEPEILGDFLLAVFGKGYFSDNIQISIEQRQHDREDVYEKFRKYVFLRYMERRHYCYIAKHMDAVLKNADENTTVNDAFMLAEKYLLKQKINIVSRLKNGSVFSLTEVKNVLNPRINDERIVIFRGYNEKTNEVMLDVIPVQLNTKAGYEYISDNSDSEYTSFFMNEYINKQRHGRRENIQLTGLAVLDICVDETIVSKLNTKGNKKHRPRNPIKYNYDFLRDVDRLYLLDSNRFEVLTLYNNSDIYNGGGGYRRRLVRYPVFIFHVLKAHSIKFDEEEYIKLYSLTSEEVSGYTK